MASGSRRRNAWRGGQVAALVFGGHLVGQRAKVGAAQQLRELPIRVADGARGQVADAGVDHGHGRVFEDIHIQHHRIGRVEELAELDIVFGDRGGDRGVAVHRWARCRR